MRCLLFLAFLLLFLIKAFLFGCLLLLQLLRLLLMLLLNLLSSGSIGLLLLELVMVWLGR